MKDSVATSYASYWICPLTSIFSKFQVFLAPVTLSMSGEEASPEAIGAVRKYCVVAGSQDSQVSSLGGSFICLRF